MSRDRERRIRWLAVFALGGLFALGCKASTTPRDAAPREPAGDLKGSFALTYYWIATEPPMDRPETGLYTDSCETVATVSTAFAKELTLAGTARLADGRVLGVTGDCACKRSPCVRVLPREQPWGVGLEDRPLAPFISVAVDRSLIPIGTHLYIDELDGALLPGYMLDFHDGCVVADDTGDRMKGQKLDWFIGRELSYAMLDGRLHLTNVTVRDGGGRCP